MDVTLEPLTATKARLFRTLYAIYEHDLVDAGLEHTLDEEGLWQPDYTAFWLEERADTRRYLIRVGAQCAGFALIGVRPFEYMSADADFRVVEFFVRAPFRRRGAGAAAARQLFDTFRGQWELSVLSGNRRALEFWRRVLHAYRGGADHEQALPGEWLLRFSTR